MTIGRTQFSQVSLRQVVSGQLCVLSSQLFSADSLPLCSLVDISFCDTSSKGLLTIFFTGIKPLSIFGIVHLFIGEKRLNAWVREYENLLTSETPEDKKEQGGQQNQEGGQQNQGREQQNQEREQQNQDREQQNERPKGLNDFLRDHLLDVDRLQAAQRRIRQQGANPTV